MTLNLHDPESRMRMNFRPDQTSRRTQTHLECQMETPAPAQLNTALRCRSTISIAGRSSLFQISLHHPHMSRLPALQRHPGARANELHKAAFQGSTRDTAALLSRGSIDVNEASPSGETPLMIAARMGHSHVVRLLLKKGADVAAESSENFAAILGAVRGGYVAVTEILLQAGADSEVTGPGGLTPLMVAALHGYSEVTRVLIKAGANVDSRASGEETPLFFAAGVGRADVVKQLLRAKADPLLAATVVDDESLVLPLGAAAAKGHLNIVRELVQQVGIAGCGGASGGVNALRWAAQGRHLDVVVMLTEEGVVDTGLAFVDAVRAGDKRCVKFLLQQQQGKPGEAAYVLLQLLHVCLLSCCPRLMRLLIDAGGNPASTMRVSTTEGVAVLDHTPLDIVEISLRDKVFDEKPATEEQLLKLEALRRLLLQVDAVHATSWLWQRYVSSTSGVSEACRRTRAAPTHLATVLPIVRRRATRRGVLLAALCRFSGK